MKRYVVATVKIPNDSDLGHATRYLIWDNHYRKFINYIESTDDLKKAQLWCEGWNDREDQHRQRTQKKQ